MGAEEQKCFLDFYAKSKARIEKKISDYNSSLTEENQLLKPFISDLADLNEGGKLLRGVFVNLGYKIAGGNDLSASDGLSMAMELFQTAVLIHDDIIDHADLRRGKVTSHKRYEGSLKKRGITPPAADTAASAALCLGDLGLYLANRMIAWEYSDSPGLGTIMCYFNDVVLRTIRGELLDVILPCEIKDPSISEGERSELLEKSVMEIYHLKTACYSVIGPLHLGMLLGGMKEEQMALIDEYADMLGIAFQIKDDILGVFSDENSIGKSVSADIEEAKLTILYGYVRQHAPELHEELTKHYGKEKVTSEDIDKVQEIFRKSGALDYARDTMNDCIKKADEILLKCDFLSEEDRMLLSGVGDYFMKRTK